MKPATDSNAAREQAVAAYAAIREHRKTEVYRAVVDCIDALTVQVQAAMVDCNSEKLIHHQIRLQQLKAQRDALVAPGGATTGFIF